MSEDMYENYKEQKERGTLTYDKVVPKTLKQQRFQMIIPMLFNGMSSCKGSVRRRWKR